MNTQHNAIYDGLNEMFELDHDFNFMNHGIFPIHTFVVNNDSIFFKNRASLYLKIYDYLHYTKKLNFKSLLEIGCGRGGGIKVLKDVIGKKVCGEDKKYEAIDINTKNIDTCNFFYKDIAFEVGDADSFFVKSKKDIIINVESSHCYSDLDNFFSRVHQTLSDDGLFFYCDIWEKNKIDLIEHTLQKHFNIEHSDDFTTNVMLSLAYTLGIIESSSKNIKLKNIVCDNMNNQYSLYENGTQVFLFYVLTKKSK